MIGLRRNGATLPKTEIDDFVVPTRQSADGATLLGIFIFAQLIIPARLVISGVPLSLSPAAVISIFIGLLWFLSQFTDALGVAKGRNPVRTSLFIYTCALIATYGYSTYGYLPADELNLTDHAMVLAAASVGLSLGVCDGVRSRERLDFVLKTLVVAGTILAVIGILQFLANFDLTAYLKLPGLRSTSQDGFVTERSDFRRVAGTTGHPIEFGVVCAMLLPLAAHYAFKARESSRPALRWWLCLGLIASGLMFSISRSAVLGAVGAGLVLFLGWSNRRRLWTVVTAVGFLAVMKVVAPGLLSTFYGLFTGIGTDDSVRYRTHDYSTAAEEISKHLLLGRGLGTWYAPKHQVFDNQYLLFMVEIGAIGTVAFFGIFVVGIYAAARARYLSSSTTDRDLGLTLAAILVVPLLASATFDLAAFSTATAMAFLIAGAAGAMLRFSQGPYDRRALGVSARLRSAAARIGGATHGLRARGG